MRLATWNINSVRLRIDLVTGFLRDHDIFADAKKAAKQSSAKMSLASKTKKKC